MQSMTVSMLVTYSAVNLPSFSSQYDVIMMVLKKVVRKADAMLEKQSGHNRYDWINFYNMNNFLNNNVLATNTLQLLFLINNVEQWMYRRAGELELENSDSIGTVQHI
jgi:hypothetical protein